MWDGQPFESDLAYSAIYGKAEKTLYVIDNYIGVKTLALLKNSKEDVEIILFSDNVGKRIGSIVEIRERETYHTLVDELLKMPMLQLT